MKKQYLFCCALLLSIPYAQYASAMQGQHNQLNQPVDHNWINQIVNEIQPRQQPTPEEAALFHQAIGSLNQQAQLVQPEQRAGQRRVLTQAEQAMVNQIVDNLESYPNFVQNLHDAGLLEQFLGQAQEEAPAAQPIVQVEHEQRQQLTDRQLQILLTLIQDLDNINRDDIKVMLMDAFTNPLVLANLSSDEFRRILTNEQRALVQEFVTLAFDAPEAQQPARVQNVQNVQNAQQEQRGLTQVEHELIAGLAQELAPLHRDDVDAVLFEAYTNPYVLAQSNAFVQVLSEQQKELVDSLLEIYTQRISQQN